ncbi:Cyanovirin-N [Mycena metata]|uniref:Cyanovirin-N n=1 Tax=Mycena metata TaxID=1033252 RepID=A0AAD7GW35_9AGAR|nr:Cyanovirin-N [Mycena metata]
MSFAENSEFVRLEGTVLHAQCRDKHNNLHESSIDLDHILGNKDGHFDHHSSRFHESASICGLNHTTLVASLRKDGGGYRDAAIDLNTIIKNHNGKLEHAKRGFMETVRLGLHM